MATIKDVAKRAGVSVATVSAVINSDSGVNVSDKLKYQVEKAIKELNYRPNRIARALSRSVTHTIAYVVPSIHNNFFSQMANYIEEDAFNYGYSIYLCNTHGDSNRVRQHLDNLIENRVAGVITTLTWAVLENNFIGALIDEKIPIVGLAGARVFSKIDTVIIDDVEGARLSIEYLLNLGHKEIGFIGARDSMTTQKRLSGYRKALQKYNIGFNEENTALGNGYTADEGYTLTGRIMENNPNISAVFVYNDVMALGVIDKLYDLGVNIPGDVAVVGYDDSFGEYTRPKLTTMALPKKEMADMTMKLLLKRIDGEKFANKHEMFVPKLIVRDST